MGMTQFWPVLTKTRTAENNDLMDVVEALKAAAESISVRVKQGIEIEAVEPVPGIASLRNQSRELVPAYGFSTTDSEVIAWMPVTENF